MGYSFDSRIRYSEIGENGCLTLPGILNYFQDCCTFHSESIGQGMEAVNKRERVWVLSAWQVVVNRFPRMGERVTVMTAPYEFRGFMGKRNFVLETENGERLAYANSFWTHVNLLTGIPEKLREEDTKGYELSAKLDMDYAPRKISLPEGFVSKQEFPVQKHHLDTNHHVNNCQYVCMAEDYLPEGFNLRQMRAEYKKQARLGDVIYPGVYNEEDKVVVLLENENGEAYAVIEFMK